MPERRPTHAKRAHAKQMNAKRAYARSKPKQPTRMPKATPPQSSHGQMLITRRHFLYGAVGVGAAAVLAGGGFALYSAAQPSADEESISVLEVPENAVSVLGDDQAAIAEDDLANYVSLVGSFDLPYGALLWNNNDSIAACLLPTEETAKPLAYIALLYLGSGELAAVLEEAVGQSEGFDIYDVRASEQGLIWTEANILDGIWRIYTASLNDGVLGSPMLVDEGDSGWETPTLAAVGMNAFWQVLPALGGKKTAEDSLLKRARFGSGSTAEVVYSSTGRMSTPPYASLDGIVITPRTNTSSVNHQLTLLDADSCEVRDKLVLPTSMKPLEAGYGDNGFTFMFDAIYNYGGGIANLGTYTPAQSHGTEDYEGLSWYRFTRTPTAAPSWSNGWFIVKSTYSVCGVDIGSLTYFALPLESGHDDYGDYLATTGSTSTFVTYTNINDTAVDGTKKKLCRVRVWAPIALA